MALRIVTWFLLLLFTGLIQGQAWAHVYNGGLEGRWADANPFRFSSQYYHAPSGLHGYACRFYDPGLQRWLTPDPLGDMGGVNPYQFNYGNPVTYADPDGRTPLVTGAIGAGIGAIVGGGIAWWQGGSSSDIMNAALRGGLAGGVAGLTMGLGSPALSGIFGNGIVAGAINGLVSGAVSDAVNQGYDLVQGTRCEFSFSELGAGAAMGGVFGGGFSAAGSAIGGMRSAMAARGAANAAEGGKRMVQVTSWAEKGVTPDLNPGRWVQLGDATKLNFWKTGLPGPKLFLEGEAPFIRLESSRVPFANSITAEVPASSLQWPQGAEVWKGILGQRQLKP